MSIIIQARKIDTHLKSITSIQASVAIEAPVNLFINNNYLITLLATPHLQKELALGWFLDEGVLQSLDEIDNITVDGDSVYVTTNNPIKEEKLQVFGVSRLLTTACGLSVNKFFKIITESVKGLVKSNYKINASEIIRLAQNLESGRLYQMTRGVHVAVLFENEKIVALAEDVGRHNTVDKVIGIGLQSHVDFSNSVLISSGRQPADMVLKAARVGIPIVVSTSSPIRSGIITAEKTGVTLVCSVTQGTMKIYAHPHRIL
jgi:FdhD protein